MINNSELISIGFLRGSYALKGEIKASLELIGDLTLDSLQNLKVKIGNLTNEFIIENIYAQGKLVIIKFQGINSREEVSKLNNKDIYLPKSLIGNLAENEFLIEDLINLQVYDLVSQKIIGKVKAFKEIPNNSLLEIFLTDENKSFLLPFQDAFIGEINLETQKLELKSGWENFII